MPLFRVVVALAVLGCGGIVGPNEAAVDSPALETGWFARLSGNDSITVYHQSRGCFARWESSLVFKPTPDGILVSGTVQLVADISSTLQFTSDRVTVSPRLLSTTEVAGLDGLMALYRSTTGHQDCWSTGQNITTFRYETREETYETDSCIEVEFTGEGDKWETRQRDGILPLHELEHDAIQAIGAQLARIASANDARTQQ